MMKSVPRPYNARLPRSLQMVVIFALCCVAPAFAQTTLNVGGDGKVSGSVTDGKDLLPGVNVVIKGTRTGTITDQKGQYYLDGVSPTDVLVFSYIGYKTQEELVKGRNEIFVTMQADPGNLEEVVVIGYGTEKR